LFLKNNRVTAIDDRITAILAHLRESVAGIYAQKKLNKLDEETDTQNWDKKSRQHSVTRARQQMPNKR